MQRADLTEDIETSPKSRSSSRRNSTSLSRRSSVKKEKEVTKKDKEGKKRSPLNSTTSSATSTPKKTVKQNLDFVVTGKQILKRCDRANSLPGSYHRRPSTESIPKARRTFESPKKCFESKKTNVSQSSKSQETSLEDDMSLDLSQVSDFEDTNSKYGIKQKFSALATSTPKTCLKKGRSCSVQSQMQSQLERKSQISFEKSRETYTCSRNSFYRTSSSASPYRQGTELDYSSVSPEYSGQSSADLSPRPPVDEISPRSQDLHVSSCCVSSCQDISIDNTTVDHRRGDGEWTNFWANYNNSISKVPMKSYYDQCPTPYRTDNIDWADLEFSTEGSRRRSPENIKNLNSIICNEGLHLTPRETQNIIKCAHILGNVLSKAIERRSKEKDENPPNIQELNPVKEDPIIEIKKKTMTLDLKETVLPIEVKEEKRCETVTTQTDISLPNTKSAPKIFENILRQLSKNSVDIEKAIDKISKEDKNEKEGGN